MQDEQRQKAQTGMSLFKQMMSYASLMTPPSIKGLMPVGRRGVRTPTKERRKALNAVRAEKTPANIRRKVRRKMARVSRRINRRH